MNVTEFVRQGPSDTPIGTARAGGVLPTGGFAGPADDLDTSRQGPGAHPDSVRTEPALRVAHIALFLLAAVAMGCALNLVLVSRLEQRATQFKELSVFRYELAAGTGPVSPVRGRHPLALGTPMALLTIPSIGLKEVVDEGTNGEVLLAGPGHLPSTVFPGGLGTSVIYGRAGTDGGPFARISQLRKGARIVVTIQDGPTNTVVFRVTDRRSGGQKIPPIGRGGARLTLVTAKESMFVPSGAVYVDANIVGSPLPTHRPVVTARSLPADELPLGIDTGNLWILVLWLLALAATVTGALWTWNRKGHLQAWIIFAAPVALVGYLFATQVSVLLPNLM